MACIKRAAVATVFVAAHIAALHGTAYAQAPGLPSETPAAAFSLAPAITPVAAPAAAPAAMPAVMASEARSVPPETLNTLVTSPLPPVQGTCTAPAELAHFDHPLLHSMRRLASGNALTIVAIGSSSTAGAGASSPAAAYPGRLAVELKMRFPGRDITVLNRGVNGEETDDMMARFAADVVAAHPQLVLWQVGTNSVLRDHPLNPHAVELHKGLDELKATDTDVVLIDPQYAPKVLAKSETPGMVEQIALAAKEENVDLFRRFEVMRSWYEVQHLGFDVFVSPDRLHMNDWGYACWAKLIGAAIADAATRPIAAAAAHPATVMPAKAGLQ
ncbi:MAG: SGNH/GDSL hydrolase family protein [Xanthobacteraceae bacterium]